eukprot:375472-Alexandrium_andersonii.AAC.1
MDIDDAARRSRSPRASRSTTSSDADPAQGHGLPRGGREGRPGHRGPAQAPRGASGGPCARRAHDGHGVRK